MIPVQIQPEPQGFADRVRNPGQAFLKTLPHKPTNKDYEKAKAKHWNRIVPELYEAYKGICAYSSHAIPWARDQKSSDTNPDNETDPTVDHFIPRHVNPDLAYEWSNYRLAMRKLNDYKGEKYEIMDPFFIKHDWFTLNFATLRVEPKSDLPKYLKNHINKTIEILRLNKDNNLIGTRQSVIEEFANGNFPIIWLENRYPFIAYELKRQGMESKIKEIFNKRLLSSPE